MQLPIVEATLLIRFGLKIKEKCCMDYTLPPEVTEKIGTMVTYNNAAEEDADEDEGD